MNELYNQFISEELNDLPQNLTPNDLVKVLYLFQEWLIKNEYLVDKTQNERKRK